MEPLEYQNFPRLDTRRRAITSTKFCKFLRVIMSKNFQNVKPWERVNCWWNPDHTALASNVSDQVRGLLGGGSL